MEHFDLYRRRLIPDECVLLKNDLILSFEDNKLVTKWNAIRPKKTLHHGISCFFFDENIKVSKFYREDGSLIYWYIDIITHSWNKENGEKNRSLVVTDLLADILIYPDGFVKVVDLGEISSALTSGLLDMPSAALALTVTDRTLEDIYAGRFKEKQAYVESFE